MTKRDAADPPHGPWPTFTVYSRIVGGEVTEASLEPCEGWTTTNVSLPRGLDALHIIIDRLWAAEGIRVAVPDPPTPPDRLVVTRNVQRGALVTGSEYPEGAEALIELATSATKRHMDTRLRREAAQRAEREAERQRQAAWQRLNPRRPDDRAASVSLRTVSGGLPTLGRRSR